MASNVPAVIYKTRRLCYWVDSKAPKGGEIMDCVFCDIVRKKHRILFETKHLIAVLDANPVAAGHSLIIPKRHVENLFGLSSVELRSLLGMLKKLKAYLDEHYKPDGYNFGANIGKAAAQTVFHCHFHVVPRHYDDPFGGFRKISGMIFGPLENGGTAH